MSIDHVSRLEQVIDLAEMAHNVSLDGVRAAIERHVAEAVRERDEARADLDRFRHTAKRYRYLASWCSVMSTDIDGNHYWVSRISSARLRGASFEEAVDKAMERDHWERSALAATEAKPVNPDGLPTYDKEKALEWVAQLRDGNKEVKP